MISHIYDPRNIDHVFMFTYIRPISTRPLLHVCVVKRPIQLSRPFHSLNTWYRHRDVELGGGYHSFN